MDQVFQFQRFETSYNLFSTEFASLKVIKSMNYLINKV
jgi:hypothetical protein